MKTGKLSRFKFISNMMAIFLILCVCVSCSKPVTTSRSVTTESSIFPTGKTENTDHDPKNRPNILIGVEYAMPGMAQSYSELGIAAVKYFPDEYGWDKMQATADSKIDFSRTDKYVQEYQDAGFTDLVLSLKTKSKWASKDLLNNFSPKPEYFDLFDNWVRQVVERYDQDGLDDMPGLKRPVNYLEIGVEFSTYEPEPVEDYIFMLEHAYKAAHSASEHVLVLHAAFLAGMVFVADPTSEQYEEVFDSVDKRIMAHLLMDIREILDRPDIFDVVNFHALSYPGEIENTVQ